MIVKRYSYNDRQRWDSFVGDSKNGTFLFLRDYMDYHQQRFHDHSLLVEDDTSKILCLLPANEVQTEESLLLFSHQGLTYGGFILSRDIKVTEVLAIFNLIISYLAELGFSEWIYKQIPTIYHQCPAEEDEYALWKHNATLSSCLMSATIALPSYPQEPLASSVRRRGMNHALHLQYQIIESTDIELFWPIMVKNLHDKYSAKPVHSLEEMQLLMQRFPQNIRCYLAVLDGKVEAGAIVYIANKETVHLQYCHASEKGKKDRVIDLLYLHLTRLFQEQGYRYFDLGTSNENGGHYLNEGLISHKQSFGAKGIAYKTYRIDIK